MRTVGIQNFGFAILHANAFAGRRHAIHQRRCVRIAIPSTSENGH